MLIEFSNNKETLMNTTLCKMVAYKQNREWMLWQFLLHFTESGVGGRGERNEINIIEYWIKQYSIPTAFTSTIKSKPSRLHKKSDEFAFLPSLPSSSAWKPHDVQKVEKENFFPLWVEWVLDFPRYQRHDY